MELFIDTSDKEVMYIALYRRGQLIAKRHVKAPRRQAEKLLPSIDSLLRFKGFKPSDLEKIIVNNQGNSFTSLRIGVITANALAYALGIPVEISSVFEAKANGRINKKSGTSIKKFGTHQIIEPVYGSKPNIGTSKKLVL